MRKIHKSADLPDGSGRVVIFEWEGRQHRDENLVSFEPDGRVRWRAKLPSTDASDCFVALTLDGDLVRANSMTGYAVWIDPATGKSLGKQFTK